MRLKSVVAPTMAQAMATIRAELGEDAIIVSEDTTAQGVRIVAAIEEEEAFTPTFGFMNRDADHPVNEEDPLDEIHDVLQGHGLPHALVERLVDATFLSGQDQPAPALRAALESMFHFTPLVDRVPSQPIMLVGPPGAGKTTTIAKLAARAVMAGRKVRLVTTDIVRAGAVEQLAAFSKILAVPLATAAEERDLARSIAAAPQGELVLIDTAGVNPFNAEDMMALARLIRSVPAEPIMVLPAGGDLQDGIEQARAFNALGVIRMIATRVDLARRLGSMLATAEAGGFGLAEYSITPSIADGLTPFSSTDLATMLLPKSPIPMNDRPTLRGQIR